MTYFNFHYIYVTIYMYDGNMYNRSMCAINSASLEISYAHLADMQSLLAIWLTDVPRDMLQIFDEVLQTVVLADFPHYNKVSDCDHRSGGSLVVFGISIMMMMMICMSGIVSYSNLLRFASNDRLSSLFIPILVKSSSFTSSSY